MPLKIMLFPFPMTALVKIRTAPAARRVGVFIAECLLVLAVFNPLLLGHATSRRHGL